MIFLIMIGAVMFTRFAAWTNLSATTSNFFIGLGLSPILFAITVLVVFYLAWHHYGHHASIVNRRTNLHPIAVSMGIDPLWFAVLVVMSIKPGRHITTGGIDIICL